VAGTTGDASDNAFGLFSFNNIGAENNILAGNNITADDSLVGKHIHSTGTLSVTGTKQFIIDHPLDPQNKYLKHFCPESNEVLDFYRGNVNMDGNGHAVVTLPDYFSAINVNYSYILTPVGDAAPNLHISKEVDGNTFEISGGLPGLKVSWQVTAVRNDAYMQSHPDERIAEVEKGASEKGKYLVPEFYGGENIYKTGRVPQYTAPDIKKLSARTMHPKMVDLKAAAQSKAAEQK